MGLIRAAKNAAKGVLADQWKEYFYCEALPAEVLAVKGQKKVRGRSANKGSDNIISNGSVIAVAEGQCMMIVEQGKVVDVCAEPGEYTYDISSEPSLFVGDGLADNFVKVFENIGMTAKERRAIWHQLELTYMPWRNYDGHKFLEEGGFWMQKQHIFVNPFYYIDYALAQICAFQFFERSKKEPEKAWGDYYRLCQAGGSKGYFALLELAGLKNPFVDGTVEEVVAGLKPYLKRKVKYTIRPVKEEDLKKVAEVEALCFPVAEAAGYEDFMERYKTCKNSFFVAETEDGEIAGFCNGCCADTDYLADALYHDATLHNPDGDYQMIFGLDVNPKFQKQGIGEALMRHMVKSAGERDKKAVVLTCKDHMIPFYKRIGYEYIELSDSTHGGAKWHKMMYRF